MDDVTRRTLVEVAPLIDYESVTAPDLLSPPAAEMLTSTLSHRGLVYAAVPGFRPLRLDLHLPAATAGRPWPVVVYVHGGSFVGGVREMGPWTSLPAEGIAVASISYRLAAEVSFPEPVEDVRAAVRWVRRNGRKFDLDPGRMSLWGSSAGALLSGIAAVSGDTPIGRTVGEETEPTHVRSVISHYGLSDASALVADAIADGEAAAGSLAEIIELFTGTASTPASVAAHVTDGVRPRYLLVHGDTDTRVGHGQSVRLHRTLTDAHFESDLSIVPGAGHGTAEFADDVRTESAIAFLRESWKE